MARVRFINVTQRFRLIHERPDTLREVFARLLRRKTRYIPFEALKKISFQINEGETLGVVGRNGSGKSTALRLMAGVFRPTSGQVTVDGKVAALIELGAGFHPDLTGRENIILNGLMLKMTRRQILEREKSIIEFSELGEFIDSPVKQYSSGMYMRLAFSIAAEVDPDILLIDEILAVGDAGFRKKCSARISDFHKRGKTIVYVSHAMDSVKQLCTRAILLHEGVLVADGTPDEIADKYTEILRSGQTILGGYPKSRQI
ncbi:MAG: ABC transporter ATP-binding protein [Acidobacteria bacterium]|nr:ABC transporter ATP-binding protein [Acidobacteriota bacterium]